MGLNDIYPVQTQPADQALILPQPEAGLPSGWTPSLVLAAIGAGLVPGLAVRFGNGAFFGNNTDVVEDGGTFIALPTGAELIWCDYQPSLTSVGSGWACMRGQYASGNAETAYFLGTLPSGETFPSGIEFYFNWFAVGALAP